jgi:(S)-ureidoglycine aminohydrolase
MQHLGQTRSAHCADHLLQTPDTFVRAPLPGMQNATAIVHIAPAAGARFTQYTAEFEPGGLLGPTTAQRFIYVIDGEIEANGAILSRGGYAYFPPKNPAVISTKIAARAAIIEKAYLPLPGVSTPACFTGRESDTAAGPLHGDNAIEVRSLVPADSSFDFAVNTLSYPPGAALPLVEIHVMEHGLLMLGGGGIYRLGDHWYPVTEGDFIWMAPYCPQWFGALGKTPAKYLIYKDWNRGPLDSGQ